MHGEPHIKVISTCFLSIPFVTSEVSGLIQVRRHIAVHLHFDLCSSHIYSLTPKSPFNYINGALYFLKSLKMRHLVTDCILPVWPISTFIILQLLKTQSSSRIEYHLKAQNHRHCMTVLNKEFAFFIYRTSIEMISDMQLFEF